MDSEPTRRKFIAGGSAAAAGAFGAGSAYALQHQHGPNNTEGPSEGEFPRDRAGTGGPIGSATDRGKLVSGYRSPADPPVTVQMPDVERLPWEEKDGVKEFHLIAEHVRREVLPNQWFDFWGFNGSMPGPLIEATQGDRVRIVIHNKLPEL